MPREPEADPLAPTVVSTPAPSAEALPPLGPPAGEAARDVPPGGRPAAGDGVGRALELLDEFLAEIERALAALGDEAAPAA